MVDISLYRGDLHKVPDVPRRWTPQTPKISYKDFKILIVRRASALSRLRSSDDDAHTEITATSSPSPSPSPASSPDHFDSDRSSENDGDNHGDHQPEKGDLKEEERFGNGRERLEKSMEENDDLMEEEDEIPEAIVNMVVEKSNAENGSGELEKRKREVKEKLEILNEKKHSLVQVLKQILSAEEHLKRHNRAQGTLGRPPLHVDTITDSGSMTKANTPRGDGDDASNHNLPSLNLPRMSSTSPSSGMVPQSNRTTLVTVSGTSYIASTPSPAASVGTSGKLPSPWN